MAIVNVSTNRGLTISTTGGANPTIDLPAGGSITVGNTLIMSLAYDNSGTAGVDPNMWVVSSTASTQVYGQDLRGNLWFRIAKAVRNAGGVANDGAVVDIWACRVTNAYTNGDDITLQFSFPVACVVARISEFSGINPRSYSVVTPTSATGSSTSFTAPAISPAVTGRLVVALAAIETNNGGGTLTLDADTTDGSWVTIAFDAANTGVDATSMAAAGQYKIVTGTSAQNWTATKTGASDYAVVAVVFDVFTNVPNNFSSGNPNYPCIAGPEILPLGYDYLPVDTGTVYLQAHQIYPNSYGTQNYQSAPYLQFNPLGGATAAHHAVMSEIYLQGSEVVSDEVTQRTLVLDSATLGAGATVSSGTAVAALEQVGGAYVTLPNAGYVDLTFRVPLSVDFPNYRVVRWGIQYLAWKDDSDPAIGVGIIPEWRDSTANNGAGAAATISAWLVPNYKRDAQFETRWIGEVNPIIRGKGEILAQNTPLNAAFTIVDLAHMDAGDQTARLRIYGAQGNDPLSATVYMDYVVAVVELVPERRLAHGSRLVSNEPTFASSHYYTDPLIMVPLWSALNTSNKWQVPAAANTYVLGTREAVPASPADYYANLVSTASGSIGRSVGFNEAIGPSFLLSAVQQPRATLENPTQTGQPVLTRGVINGGVLAGPPEEFDNFILSSSAIDAIRWQTDGAFWVAYSEGGSFGRFSEIYTAHSLTQQVVVDGATTFDRVKVLVYPDELTTANLTITVEQPSLTVLATATLTPAQVLALPDLGNGFREISAALNVSVTPTAGQVVIRFASTTGSTAPWRIGMGYLMGSLDAFGYNFGDFANDRAAVLQCLLAAPSVSLGTSTQSMYRPTGRCVSASIHLPSITLTNGATYDWVSIERSTDGGTTYVPVVLLHDTTNGQVYVDAAVPWDQPALSITYRVTGYRDADHLADVTVTSGWNDVATAPGAVFGLAVDQVLYAYLPADETELSVVWNPLNPTSIVPLLGVDYQIPIRAPEERGLEVSFLVVIDQLVVCGPTGGPVPWDETLAPGAESMSPAPYDQLRDLALTERFALLLPGGHTRWTTMTLGNLTVRTQIGLYLADVTLTDVTVPEVDPYF